MPEEILQQSTDYGRDQTTADEIGRRFWIRQNPSRWLVLCGVSLVAAIAVGTAMMIGNFRERELENTVLLLARHFDERLQDFGAIQEDLVAYLKSNGFDTGEFYERRMSSPDIHLMLKAKIDALSYVGDVNLFDSEGILINSSNTWPVPAVNVADRAYFKAFKSDPQSPSILLDAVRSRITGVWTIVLARKLTGRNGEFLGAIGRGVQPAYFAQFFSSVTLEKTPRSP